MPELTPKRCKREELEMGSAGSGTATSLQHHGGRRIGLGTVSHQADRFQFVFLQDAELCPKRPLAGSEMPQGF